MAKRINLMHIVLSLEVGGLENLVLSLLEKLDKAKFNLSICCLSMGGALEEELYKIGVPVYHIKKNEGIDFSLYFRLARLFARNKIDIIHTHNPTPWFYSVISAKLSGVKIAIHTEHSAISSKRKLLGLAEKFLAYITDIIICDSEIVARHLINEQGVTKKKVITILNGVNIDKFKGEVDIKTKKNELGIKENSVIIGNIARLEPIKNHIFLLDVFKIIYTDFPRAVLVIVGGGSQAENLRNKTRELGLEDAVFFLGPRTDIPHIIKIFDLFVLTSISEGLSLSLLEAMSSEKPIVASDVGGNREVVVNGETGFLFSLNQKEEFCKAIISVLEDKELSKQLGEAGLKRAKKIFSLENMVMKYEDVYNRYLKERT